MTSERASFESGVVVEESTGQATLSKSTSPTLRERRRSLLTLAGIAVVLALAAIYHYAIYLPQPDVPHWLTLLDDVFALGVFGLIGLVGLVLGRRLLRPFRLAGFSRPERGALALGLGWGALSLAVLALGLAHLFYNWLLIAGLALVLVICWRDAAALLLWLTTPGAYRWLRPAVPRSVSLWTWTLVVILGIEAVMLGMQAVTFPSLPRGFDLYQYHWAVPRLYFLHHAILAFPGWAHANFPFNSEMLDSLALAFDAPIAAIFLQASFGLLAVVLIAGFLYRRSGALAAWLGVALCLCNPLVAGLLISGYTELAVTFYGAASFVLVLSWLEQKERTEQRRLFFLAGLFAGLGLGTKYTEGQIIIGVVLLLVGWGILEAFLLRRQQQPLLPVFRLLLLHLVVYGAAILLVVLPWLLKDWVLLGNPIYPFVWGGPEWDAARTQTGAVTLGHFGPRGPLWQRLLTGIVTPFWETGHTDDPPFTPLNFLLLLAWLAPLGWMAERFYQRRRERRRSASLPADQDAGWALPWLVVAAGGYLAWLFSGAAVARYGTPWLTLLAVPAALILVRAFHARSRTPALRRIARTTRVLVPGITVLIAALAVIYSGIFWWVDQPLPLLTGQMSLHEWQTKQLFTPDYWKMLDYVQQHIPQSARLLLIGQGTGYFFEGYDYIADSGEDWIPYLETEGRTPAGILALLHQDHFRYLIYGGRTLTFVTHVYENHYLASFLPAFRQFLAGSLKRLWTYDTFSIYQIPSS